MRCMRGSGAQVVVANNLPGDYPSVSEGISIHWHGFSMGGAEWYDGVGYLAMCPIRTGSNFTYRFQVGRSRQACFHEFRTCVIPMLTGALLTTGQNLWCNVATA